ncbi:MAG: hypothetical protein IKE58_04200 [Blautia sp.]|nr:hypothetical protein [Blautia sp.]
MTDKIYHQKKYAGRVIPGILTLMLVLNQAVLADDLFSAGSDILFTAGDSSATMTPADDIFSVGGVEEEDSLFEAGQEAEETVTTPSEEKKGSYSEDTPFQETVSQEAFYTRTGRYYFRAYPNRNKLPANASFSVAPLPDKAGSYNVRETLAAAFKAKTVEAFYDKYMYQAFEVRFLSGNTAVAPKGQMKVQAYMDPLDSRMELSSVMVSCLIKNEEDNSLEAVRLKASLDKDGVVTFMMPLGGKIAFIYKRIQNPTPTPTFTPTPTPTPTPLPQPTVSMQEYYSDLYAELGLEDLYEESQISGLFQGQETVSELSQSDSLAGTLAGLSSLYTEDPALAGEIAALMESLQESSPAVDPHAWQPEEPGLLSESELAGAEDTVIPILGNDELNLNPEEDEIVFIGGAAEDREKTEAVQEAEQDIDPSQETGQTVEEPQQREQDSPETEQASGDAQEAPEEEEEEEEESAFTAEEQDTAKESITESAAEAGAVFAAGDIQTSSAEEAQSESDNKEEAPAEDISLETAKEAASELDSAFETDKEIDEENTASPESKGQEDSEEKEDSGEPKDDARDYGALLVTDASDFIKKMNQAGNGERILLGKDITIPADSAGIFLSGREVTLDLNGFSLALADERRDALFAVTGGGALALTSSSADGAVYANGNPLFLVTDGSEGGFSSLSLDHCTLYGSGNGRTESCLLYASGHSMVNIHNSQLAGLSAHGSGSVLTLKEEASLFLDASAVSGNSPMGITRMINVYDTQSNNSSILLKDTYLDGEHFSYVNIKAAELI